jgi:hypothetical protein
MKLGERAEKHRAAGSQFKVLIRDFERISAESKSLDSDREALLADLKKRLDSLEVEAPVVPAGIYEQVQSKYSSGNVEYVATVDELTSPDKREAGAASRKDEIVPSSEDRRNVEPDTNSS